MSHLEWFDFMRMGTIVLCAFVIYLQTWRTYKVWPTISSRAKDDWWIYTAAIALIGFTAVVSINKDTGFGAHNTLGFIVLVVATRAILRRHTPLALYILGDHLNVDYVVHHGKRYCKASVRTRTVQQTPNGEIGPWIQVTCEDCPLEWYARPRNTTYKEIEVSENNEGVERTEERSSEKVVQEPVAPDAGGPLGNVTAAVTNGETTETVVERTEETVTEKPADTES